MYKKPKIKNLTCPLCLMHINSSHKLRYDCQLWNHFLYGHLQPSQEWYRVLPMSSQFARCPCGVVVAQFQRHKVVCSLFYDHFRRLEPHEVQEHFIMFAMGCKPVAIEGRSLTQEERRCLC